MGEEVRRDEGEKQRRRRRRREKYVREVEITS